MPQPTLSYAQRYEDLYLMRCFGSRRDGFYIDIGSGHPVHDNTSFAFYLAGWRGISVEPNPRLARLTRAVRPRDRHVEAAVGAAPGTASFYLVEDYHGLSTMFADNARAAHSRFGKSADTLCIRVLTLAELCRQFAPASFDFLKVDVEGAERDVLLHGDWQAYRPKVVLVEALAPYTLEPAWEAWEPFLQKHGYRHVWFDSLNRYYVAEEAAELARCFREAPAQYDLPQFRNLQGALADERHPDHAAAAVIARALMIGLPLLPSDLVLEFLTSDIPAASLDRPATEAQISQARNRLFGRDADTGNQDVDLPASPTLREVYAALINSDRFYAACGRISASYAW